MLRLQDRPARAAAGDAPTARSDDVGAGTTTRRSTVVMAAKRLSRRLRQGHRDPRPRRGRRRGRCRDLPRRHAGRKAPDRRRRARAQRHGERRRPCRGAGPRLCAPSAKLDWPDGFCRSRHRLAGAAAGAKIVSAKAMSAPCPTCFSRLCRAAHRHSTRASKSTPASAARARRCSCCTGIPDARVLAQDGARVGAALHAVIADLRGYGASSAPGGDAEHTLYSKRAMAEDWPGADAPLGHSRFMVAGHDRGGRVAYRLALDHPEAVTAVVPIDIIPTGEVWQRANAGWALSAYHWSFLSRPHRCPRP